MGKVTVSLPKEVDTLLRNRAKKNFRSISKEISYLLYTVEKLEQNERGSNLKEKTE